MITYGKGVNRWSTVEIEDLNEGNRNQEGELLYNSETLYTVPFHPTPMACHPLSGLTCGQWWSLGLRPPSH